MAAPNPLTEQDLEDIDKALVTATEAQELMEQSKRAGIDVTEYEQRARDARDGLMRIKQVFFPGK